MEKLFHFKKNKQLVSHMATEEAMGHVGCKDKFSA